LEELTFINASDNLPMEVRAAAKNGANKVAVRGAARVSWWCDSGAS